MPVTDPELADELVATIREWVRKDVIPKASEYEHADEYPAAVGRADEGVRALRRPHRSREYGGLGLDTLTYARLMEELSYGWMSLAGVLNTHTIAATLIDRFGTDEQQARWLPAMATGEPSGRVLAVASPTPGSDTQAIRCKADARRRRVRHQRHEDVGHQRRAGRASSPSRRGPPEGITCFIVEKEPGPAFGGITVSRRIDKLGYKGLETVEMTYVDHRVPAANVLGGDDGPRPRPPLHARVARARPHQHRGARPSASPAPPSTPR